MSAVAQPRRRWSVFALGADLAFFHLAMALASQQTLVPAFAERLGASNTVIGLIPALLAVGWMLPAVFAAHHTEQLARKLPFILRWTILERLSFPILAVAAWLLAVRAPELTLALLLVLLILMTFVGGWLMPAWLDLIARAVPTVVRGRFFALANGGGSILGLGGAAAVTFFLDGYGFPVGYALCFAAATVAVVISFVFLATVREVPGPASTPRGDLFAYLRRLPTIVMGNPNLARFLIARIISVVGALATGFFMVYALKELQMPDAAVGIFTTVSLFAQTAGALLCGWLADRRGHVTTLALGALFSALAAAVAIGAGDLVGMAVVFAFMGLHLAATQVSAMPVGLELGPDDERPTYVAINNSSVAPFALVSPLIGGAIADTWGFAPLFILGAVISLGAALTYVLFVRDPRSLSRPAVT